MNHTIQHGFSLIEALITALVLSIGLLGLGQLQARLWFASGDLHSLSDAYLLANSYLEKSITSEFFSTDFSKTPTSPITYPGTEFKTVLTISPGESIIETDIEILWANREGSHSIQLATAIETPAAFYDARWFLPAD